MEKQIRHLYFIIVCIIFYFCFSCRTQNIAGTYICEYYSFYNYHTVILEEDGNCLLLSRDFMSPDTTFGKWKLEKNNRYFTIKLDNYSHYLLSICDTCTLNKINVFDALTKEKMMYAHIQIYYDSAKIDEYIADSTGSIAFKRNTYDSIKINYIGYAEANVEYNRGINNIDVLLVKKKYLPKEKWKIISHKKIKLLKCCTYIKQN